MSIRTIVAAFSPLLAIGAVALPVGLLGPDSPPARAAAPAPACTSPAVVNDGLIEVRCFPVIPAKQFPTSAKCSHVDAWTTGHSIETVNGQTYRITQKVRDDVWICKG